MWENLIHASKINKKKIIVVISNKNIIYVYHIWKFIAFLNNITYERKVPVQIYNKYL